MTAETSTTPQPKFVTAAQTFSAWRDDVLSNRPPTLYPIGSGELERIEVGPGLVTLVGGGPGAGKTAFTMQTVIDALRLTPTLRACVCNVEMSPSALLDRQLARLSGVPLTMIRKRQLGAEHREPIERGMETLKAISERLCFVQSPFDLANVVASANAFGIGAGGGLVVLDYVQRIKPPGEHHDKRSSMEACISSIRTITDCGAAVIVVSAVSRSKDVHGRNSYGDLGLASFRESSELEYGADSAFILAPEHETGDVTLKHLKDRYGECRDIRLCFDKPQQSFTVEAAPIGGNADSGREDTQ